MGYKTPKYNIKITHSLLQLATQIKMPHSLGWQFPCWTSEQDGREWSGGHWLGGTLLLAVTVSNTKCSHCFLKHGVWRSRCSWPTSVLHPESWARQVVNLIWSSARVCSPPLLSPRDQCFGPCFGDWASHRFGPWTRKRKMMWGGTGLWQKLHPSSILVPDSLP